MSSTPGICSLTKYGSTNAEIFKYENGSFDAGRLMLVRTCVLDRINKYLLGKDCGDNIKVFIKQEPHKVSKLLEERYRIISGVSIIDSLIDRMLFMDFCHSVIDNVLTHPMMIGWAPLKDGVEAFHYMMGGHYPEYVCLDKSAWDWTMPYWLLKHLYEIIVQMHSYVPSYWKLLVFSRFKALYVKPKWQFKDGSIIEQKVPGIQKSGCYLTIVLNSMAQLYLHVVVSNRMQLSLNDPFLCLGDDTIQVLERSKIDEYVHHLETMGFKVKVTISSDAQFCGFIIKRSSFHPEYRDKHAFVLKHLTLDKENALSALQSYQVIYCCDEEVLRFLREIAVRRSLPKAIVSERNLRAFRP